jgi:hypothetical protein
MNSFSTRSSARKSMTVCFFTFPVLFALAFLGLLVAVTTWLFFELILLICFGLCMGLTASTRTKITFTGRKLTVYSTGNRQTYVFDALTAEDILITQSKRQKKADTCDMKFRGTLYGITELQNCTALRAYLAEHF